MATIQKLFNRLREDKVMSTEEMIYWADKSDTSQASAFFGNDLDAARLCVRTISDTLITKYMNNPDVKKIPLDKKTRACLIVSNFALFRPVRSCIFDLLDKLGNVFEDSIKADATLPFNPELGRMTEHVAVLLMRVTGYKLKAASVLEFTDGNVQFSVQLMLAVLLKEPPYESPLRCNCIGIILGFTQPQAYFDNTASVEDASCKDFTDKVDGILKLMLRLNSVQVIDDVISDQLDNLKDVTPLIHVATCNSMRCIMNIFRFSSESSTQWRQHVLLSTTLLDHSVTQYLQLQYVALQKSLALSKPAVNMEVLRGMSLGFKFASLCTFGMGGHAQETRLFFPYLHDMLQLPVKGVLNDAGPSHAVMRLYADMFHLMANIDALGGDGCLPTEDLFPQLRSIALLKSVSNFLRREIAPFGLALVRTWHAALRTVEPDTLVERGAHTYLELESIFNEVEVSLLREQAEKSGSNPASEPDAEYENKHGADDDAPDADSKNVHTKDLPPVCSKTLEKVPIESAAEPVAPAHRTKPVDGDATVGVDKAMLCALTGNIMKRPVLSPYGHTFEKDTILAWLQQNGSVCPITGKPLTPEELKLNKDVKALIVKHTIEQSMKTPNQENEVDIYDF
uniref:Uncharacterized protein TCIL3000_3_2260 n=1 Tax=Trypanosoma congolense (strain IL3000) TaxID=1068625 RepID=G0UK89_TRYCI|nr:unnamed protein product [Trypanosoma congolense IL3000]